MIVIQVSVFFFPCFFFYSKVFAQTVVYLHLQIRKKRERERGREGERERDREKERKKIKNEERVREAIVV